MSKRPQVVHGEFGTVPSSVSTPNFLREQASSLSFDDSATALTAAGASPHGSPNPPAASVTQLWLSVQKAKDENAQRAILVGSMYEVFITACTSSTSVPFRQAFGDGTSLISVICRLLCAETRLALRAGFPECREKAKLLLDDASHLVLVSYLSTVCEPDFYAGVVEQASFESVLRILALHNIPSILSTLHKAFLELVELAGTQHSGDVSPSITAQMASADQKYLSLLHTLLSHQHANQKQILTDLQQSSSVVAVAETLPVALLIPFWASGSMAELAAQILTSVLANREQRLAVMTPRVVDDVERVLMDGIMKEADSAHEGRGDASLRPLKVIALTQTLAVLLALRREYHSKQNYSLEFGLVVTVMLGLQHAMAQQRRTTERLVQVLEGFSTLPLLLQSSPLLTGTQGSSTAQPTTATSQAKPSSSSSSSSKKGGLLSFSALASHVSKFVSGVVGSADKHVDAGSSNVKTVTAPQVLECMSSFIICATVDDARVQVARSLFQLLQVPGQVEDALCVSQLSVLANAVGSMSLLMLAEFLLTVDVVVHRVSDAAGVLTALARKILDVEHVSEEHIIKLVAFFASLGCKSSASGLSVLRSGVLVSTSRLVESLGMMSLREETLKNVLRLWVVAVAVPGAVQQLDDAGAPSAVLHSMLNCGIANVAVAKSTSETNRAIAEGGAPSAIRRVLSRSVDERKDAAAEDAKRGDSNSSTAQPLLSTYRELLATLVGAKREWIAHVTEALLHYCSPHEAAPGWCDEISALVAALVVALSAHPNAVEHAIRGNAFELCMSLLQRVRFSGRIAEETALLAAALSLMVPCVRFSEIGRVLSVSIPEEYVGSGVFCQFLADLATGALRNSAYIADILEWYDIALSSCLTAASLSSSPHSLSGAPAGVEPTDATTTRILTTTSSSSRILRRSTEFLRIEGTPFYVSCAQHVFCELAFPFLELCRWYRRAICDQTTATPALVDAGGCPQPEELLRLILHLSDFVASPLSDPAFAWIAIHQHQLALVPLLADVTALPAHREVFLASSSSESVPPSSETQFDKPAEMVDGASSDITSLEARVQLWSAAVLPLRVRWSDGSGNHSSGASTSLWNAQNGIGYVQFFGAGGATGSVKDSVGDEGWPSSEGYSVSMWCWWSRWKSPKQRKSKDESSPNNGGSDAIQGVPAAAVSTDPLPPSTSGDASFERDSGQSTPPLSSPTREPYRGVVPLWACRWSSTDPLATPCSTELEIDLDSNCSTLRVQFQGAASTLSFPLVPQRTWTHVVISHQRSKLFPSEASVFMDGVLVKKAQVTYPLTMMTQASGYSLCDAFQCHVGFEAQSRPPSGEARSDSVPKPILLRVGPFSVYNAPQTKEEVVGLFCGPASSLASSRWGAFGEASVSLLATVLGPCHMNYITATAANQQLASVLTTNNGNYGDAGTLNFTAPTHQSSLVVALHPTAGAFVDAPFRYLDNRLASLVNLASPRSESVFVLCGPHSEPPVHLVDASFALVSHGAPELWLLWLTQLRDWYLASPTSVEPMEAQQLLHRRLARIAAALLDVIAVCAHRVSHIHVLQTRAFYFNLSLLLRSAPRFFFAEYFAGTPSCEFALFCTLAHADGSPMGSKWLSPRVLETQRMLLPVATNAAMCDMVLCHIGSWVNLPEALARNFLTILQRLLQPSNRYCRLNAIRLRYSGFVDNFLYGLCRAYVSPTLLLPAVDVVQMFIAASCSHTSASDGVAVVSEVLTFLASTVATEGDHAIVAKRLSSKLAAVAPTYVVLVRNVVLRGVLECLSADPQSAVTQTFGDTMPLAWIAAVTGRHAHPVTVALSLQLILSVVQRHSGLRTRVEKGHLLKLLMSNLQFHSHQPDVTSLLLHAFMGHQRNVLVYQTNLIDESLAPNPERGLPYLMYLILYLQKQNAIGARDPSQIHTATSFYEQIPCSAYFARANRAVTSFRMAHRKLRAALMAVRAIGRLVVLGAAAAAAAADRDSSTGGGGAVGARGGTGRSSQTPTAAPGIVPPPGEPSVRILEDECIRRRDLASRVLNWVAISLLKYEYVSCATFNPAALCASGVGVSGPGSGGLYATPAFAAVLQLYGATHPLDFVAWILVCALGNLEGPNGSDVLSTESPAGGSLAPYRASSATDGGDEDASDEELEQQLRQSRSGAGVRGGCREEECFSCGLDSLPSPPLDDALFQSCCSVYMAVMEQQLRDYVALYVGKQSVKTSPYALILHHVLCTCPHGIGDHAERWFDAAVLSLWLQTTGRSLQRHSLSGDTGHHLSKNCVSVAHYAVERLSSGLPTPPNNVVVFLATLLGTLQYQDHVKQVRHLLLEWLLFVSSPRFHNHQLAKVHGARDLLHQHRQILFSGAVSALSVNTVDCQKHLLVNLLELSALSITDYASTQTPGAKRLAEIWTLVLTTYRSSAALTFVLAEGCGQVKASGGGPYAKHYDLWHGGFDMLFQRIGGAEMFLGWLADQRLIVSEYVTAHPPLQPLRRFKLGVTAGFGIQRKRYLKWMDSTLKDVISAKSAWEAKADEALRSAQQSWERFRNSTTLIDAGLLQSQLSALLVPSDVRLPPQCQPGASVGDASVNAPGVVGNNSCSPAEYERCYKPLLAGGVPYWQRRRRAPDDAVHRFDEVAGEPLGVYVSSVPSSLIPMQSGIIADVPSAAGHLKFRAAAVLEKIILGNSLEATDTRAKWVGNAYFLSGTDSIVCTVTITCTELIVISHSQVTEAGDFFVMQLRPHTALDKSSPRARRAAERVQDTLRRFLPREATAALGSATTAVTGTSIAVHRHSQYYRQLRTEALQHDTHAVVFRYPIQTISFVHHRRFQHQSAGVEICFEHCESVFAVILDRDMTMSKEGRQAFLSALRPFLPVSAVEESSKAKKSRLASLQRKWVRGAISNTEYLAACNDAASRTVADLSQYPIMPWVLSQYDELVLNLNDAQSYRDLSKPMGALNPHGAAQVAARFRDWPDESQPPFHHGTHYSTSAIVMYFLVRLEPFHRWSVRFQGGRLDVADRLFHSVGEAWTSSSGCGSDVKELIPEWYSSAAWVANANRIQLGQRRDGVALDSAVLPLWCGAHRPEVFVNTLVEALESDTVSAGLHRWIDLIFGFQQRGEAAEKALNVFHHVSYDEGFERAMATAASEEDRKAIVSSVDNFGLTPKQLFTSQHPKRSIVSVAHSARQLAFLSAVSLLTRRPSSLPVVYAPLPPWTRPEKGASSLAIHSVYLVDSTLLASHAISRLTRSKPTLVVWHDEALDSLTVIAKDLATSFSATGGGASSSGAPSASIGNASLPSGVSTSFSTAASGGARGVGLVPSPAAYGAGHITCFTTNDTASTIACGTDRGVVAVFYRRSYEAPYLLRQLLRAPSQDAHSQHSARVRCLHLYSDGQLLAASDPCYLTAWLLGSRGACVCFSMDLGSVLNDSLPLPSSSTATVPLPARPTLRPQHSIRFVARDEARKHFYVATQHHIAAVTNCGIVLAVVALKNQKLSNSALSTRGSGAQASAVVAADTLVEPITCVHYVAASTHSTTNVLIAGHANGAITIWTVQAELQPSATQASRTFSFHSCVVIEKGVAVTCVFPVLDSNVCAVGLADGSVVLYHFPLAPLADIGAEVALAV